MSPDLVAGLAGLAGPWPHAFDAAALAGDLDPPGPLAVAVFLPLLGAAVTAAAPRPMANFFARAAALWTLPGALFLVAAAALAGAPTAAVRWAEVLPGGAVLLLSPLNLVAALAVGLVAPLGFVLPEPQAIERERAAWLLVFLSSVLGALLAATPGLVVLAWAAGAWSIFALAGVSDPARHGERALGPLVAHAAAACAVAFAALLEGGGGWLVVAGAVRLGVPPFHGLFADLIESLPTGAGLVVGTGLLVTGVRALHDGLVLAPPALVGPARAFFAAGVLYAGLAALPRLDLRARLAGFLSAQSAAWAVLGAALAPPAARAAVGAWALLGVAGFAALVSGFARLWEFTRTGDLRAYGGLARAAPVRSALLALAVVSFAVAPVFGLARAAGPVGELVLSWPLGLAAVALGWSLGFLALALAVYRALRGRAPAPLPAPEFTGREWLWALPVFALLLALTFAAGPLGGLAGLWPPAPGAIR